MATEQSGERKLQRQMGTSSRADGFYENQMLESLNEKMTNLIKRQEMVFVATADAAGNCDCSPRFGQPGFVRVIAPDTLAYPEYRGNGVYASLGNILENPHAGLVFLDFFDTTVGLHVNGGAQSFPVDELPAKLRRHLTESGTQHSKPIERWVVITVDEAYIHCSKHVPRLQKLHKRIDWGTDNPGAKSVHFFVEPDQVPQQER